MTAPLAERSGEDGGRPVRQWGPSSFGKLFTSTPAWSLTQWRKGFLLEVAGLRRLAAESPVDCFKVTPGTFWSEVTVTLPDASCVRLDGISNSEASSLDATLKAVEQRRVLLRDCDEALLSIVRWAKAASAACAMQLRSRGWLTQEFIAEQESTKPRALAGVLEQEVVSEHIKRQPPGVLQALAYWNRAFASLAEEENVEHLDRERVQSKNFFDTVEKSPLTREQVDAVVCFDSRVLLIAAAGSGKTATMVAKAGYALHKGYFGDGRMLLLAFNNDAARELRERIEVRLAPQGLAVDRVSAKTFHAFGLEVIGAATGKRPSVAPWIESGQDEETLLEIVDRLKDTDAAFRAAWDLFRLVLSQDLPKFGKEESPDSWDAAASRTGFRTLNNEVVRSRGEVILADWLFYNGVEYRYEAPYKYPTADPNYRQYAPDFYLPQIDAYLEHWALDEHGRPPADFAGYAEGMAWKRALHERCGTVLLETTTAGLWTGEALQYLASELTTRGIELDPNPERPIPGRKPVENPRLLRTFRAFLTHCKSNRSTVDGLRSRLAQGKAGDFRYRHAMFLTLFESVWEAWEKKLRDGGYIDFDDMLGLAADCIERGEWTSPYELVMVDEFQDVSQARARLIAGLTKERGRCLFGVGDDWQGINRFAGADISVMTEFEPKFGKARLMKLQTTFRCPQSLCDITSGFVQKNPKQLNKTVRSAVPDVLNPVRVVSVEHESEIAEVVRAKLEEIRTQAISEGLGPTSVFLMGRYNFDREYAPSIGSARTPVAARFITAHASKGLEADHVIVVRATADVLGFPCGVEDDPVLQLAMPSEDDFSSAEERRLFYVALTRARKTATLVTVTRKQSTFIVELVKDYCVPVVDGKGENQERELCPRCSKGFMLPRNGKHGPFYGCSRFPACEFSKNTASAIRSSRRTARLDMRSSRVNKGKG